MKRKFLEDLGLTKEQIDGIMSENGKDINEAKGDLDNVKSELETANNAIKERDTQLEQLKSQTGNAEELKAKIEALQEENKTAKETYEQTLKDTKLNAAIKLAISGKAQDEDLVTGLLDKSKLILGEDGKITGLDEQLKTLQESKSFLFKQEQQSTVGGFKPTTAFTDGEKTSMEAEIDKYL